MRFEKTEIGRNIGLVFLIFLGYNIEKINSAHCYSCIALNYRQRVLSPNDQVAPAQTKDNLTELFDELTRLQIPHPMVSSGCADVALTAQLTFFNTPHVQCSGACAKMNFNFQGEKVVLRNCFSNFPSIHKINHTCRIPGEEPSELALGDFRNTSTNTMIMFKGYLEASNNITSADIEYDDCVTLCLDNPDCVSYTYSNICTIFSIDQFDNFTKNDSTDERLGIKINLNVDVCPIFPDLDLSGNIGTMNYHFDKISDNFYNVNVTSCYGWKVFRRTRGYYCINLFESTSLLFFDLNYCSTYSSYLAGFDNQNEINYIVGEIRKRSPGRTYFGIDGQRKSDCYNGNEVICNDFEWTNNYSQSPPLINWNTNEPSMRNIHNKTETNLSLYCQWSSVNVMNDIAPNDYINGYICGMPVGDWDLNN